MLAHMLAAFPPVLGSLSGVVGRIKTAMYRSNLSTDRTLRLDNAALLLYNQCANELDYKAILHELNLKDIFVSWFRITILHIWLVLLRIQKSLDEEEFARLRDTMLLAMWKDVGSRIDELKSEWSLKRLAQKQNYEMLDFSMKDAFCEYDEGVLGTDKDLAGAVWRCLYDLAAVEPIYLSKTVKFIRKQVYLLERVSCEKILSEGIKMWKKRR